MAVSGWNIRFGRRFSPTWDSLPSVQCMPHHGHNSISRRTALKEKEFALLRRPRPPCAQCSYILARLLHRAPRCSKNETPTKIPTWHSAKLSRVDCPIHGNSPQDTVALEQIILHNNIEWNELNFKHAEGEQVYSFRANCRDPGGWNSNKVNGNYPVNERISGLLKVAAGGGGGATFY